MKSQKSYTYLLKLRCHSKAEALKFQGFVADMTGHEGEIIVKEVRRKRK